MAATKVQEASLEAYFRTQIRELGGLAYKVVPIESGLPDRMCFLPGGRVYFIELKTEDGPLRPIQRLMHSKLAAVGTEVIILAGRRAIDEWVSSLSR